MEKIIITTADGSHTVYVPDMEEHYHSINGAIGESMHVFIASGLNHCTPANGKLNIFEVGMGTGLNAFLTFLEASNREMEINYTAIESDPLDHPFVMKLNYLQLLQSEAYGSVFTQIHESPWGEAVDLSPKFHFLKIHSRLQDVQLSDKYQLVYFDAFAPNKQPDIWVKGVFEKVFEMMDEGGVLVTYSAKSSVKRDLTEIGFNVETLPGPPGKREMIRATKP